MNFNCQKKSGFTLVELLLYIGISSAILLATSIFLSVLLESRVKNQTVSEVEQQGVQLMQIITQTIRNAETINTPSIGTSGASLSLNNSAASTTPTVFDLSGGVMRIKEGTNALINLSNSDVTVSNLSFTNLSRTSSPGVIKISFTLVAINISGRNEYSFTKTFIDSASLR